MNKDGSWENTDELLSADLNEDGICLFTPSDHCDLLLDAIDAQLTHLQVQERTVHKENAEQCESPSTGCLDRSRSVSKDTGLGSIVPNNGRSARTQSNNEEQTEHEIVMKHGTIFKNVWHMEENVCIGSTSNAEQYHWRLERLLGREPEVVRLRDLEDDVTTDSVCTEDFSNRFREEMLVLPSSASHLDKTNVFSPRQTTQSIVQSYSSSDGESLVEWTSSEGTALKLHRSSGTKRKKRRLKQNRKKEPNRRDEMDRLLENSKSELFSEQKRLRHTLDSMQQELELSKRSCRSLGLKCSELEQKLEDANKKSKQKQLCLQNDLEHQVKRSEALEQSVSQKDLLLHEMEKEKHDLLLEFCNCIQMKDEEIKQLKDAVELYKEKIRRQEEKFSKYSQEKIENAVQQAERKCQEQREKVVEEICATLGREIEEAEMRGRADVERERKKTLEMKNKVSQIQKAAEKEAELLKQSVQRSEKELEELRAVFIEREEKQQRRAAKQEHQSRRWAQEIHTECVCLQELLKPSGPTVDIKHCPTVGDSLQTLQTLTKALQKFINDLKNELSCATLQLSHEEVRAKHQGPKDQREEEREEALIENQMKQAQEHLEEISSRSKGQLHLSDTDVYVHLLRQEELGELPNIKPQWEGKTKTNKPELELNPEVERVASKSGAERQRRLEDELRHLTLAGAVSQNSQGHLDVTSHKLLKHLQSRIHLLQTESQNQIPWTFKLNGDPSNLEGSYLDTIASDRQRWNHVPEKTFSS